MTRISRESRAVAQLVDVFEDRLYVYIVMDLLEGGDLEQLLEVSTFSAWYCLQCMVHEVLQAALYAGMASSQTLTCP